VSEVLDLGEQARVASRGAFDVRRPGPDGAPVLDPAGVVKGWAVERAARHLEESGVPGYCLSAGGDMVCRTRLPQEPEWTVGIEDPHDPKQVVAKVPVRNGAVATSGLAHRGAHLTDARTGATPDALASVTVVDDSLTWADIDATAAFALGVDGPGWLRERGRTAVIVWADGRSEVLAPARPTSHP
jgi:thiamine biosynthesis lipoprotein